MKKDEMAEGLSRNEKKLLLALSDSQGTSTPEELMRKGVFEQEVEAMGAASWLANKGLLDIEENTSRFFTIPDPGSVEGGLPERKAIKALSDKGGKMELSELAADLPGGEDKIAVGWLKRKGLADIVKDGNSKTLILTAKGKDAVDQRMPDEELLDRILISPVPENEADASVIKDLKGRQGMIDEKTVTRRKFILKPEGRELISKGIDMTEEIVQMTTEIIQSGKWKDAKFRKYDVQTFAPPIYPAKKHPLSRLGAEIREIFTQMGFTEIDEEYVQPAFWNLDALFTPQDHPARELQDTFYLESPSSIKIDDDELVEKIRRIHENGGDTGSTGWGGKWSREKAESALLRTHTTVNTVKYISNNPEPPVKVFSLSRIFRKESIDSTHLPEFTQIEGIIIDENGNFDMLVSLIKTFYRRMGFDRIRIRPAYFPYTEPSLEVEVFFNGKWMELGGAGIFRPEVTEPFGVKYPVLAWGFGFERLAMLKWNIKDIRDLYVSDVDLLKKNAVF